LTHKVPLFREDIILDLVRGKRVLHIGCADYPYHIEKSESGQLFHQKLMQVCDFIIGIDNNRDAVEFLKKNGFNNVYYGDIIKDQYEIPDLSIYYFDYILLGEVIEHLSNPGVCLENLTRQFPSFDIIITTPNAFSLNNLQVILTGKENVHPDHCFYLSKQTIEQLFSRYHLEATFFSYAYWGSFLDHSLLRKCMHNIILKRIPHFGGTLIFIVHRNNLEKIE
jgi:hypothetical protein